MTKGKQLLIEAGNWVWSLFTINVAWFLINFPLILTAIFMMTLPVSIMLVITVIIFTLMLGIFTLPSLAAVFRAIDLWKENGSKSYFMNVFKTWITEIPNVSINFVIASLGGTAILLFRMFDGNVIVESILLVWGIVLIAFTISQAYLQGTNSKQINLISFTFSNFWKLVMAAMVFTIFIMINGFLKLAFLMLICSVSLSALVSYNLLKLKSFKD